MTASPASPRRVDLVVFLHGVGSSGDDLADFAADWGRRLGLATASPDAPFAFDAAAVGRQWFSILGVSPVNRAARVEAGAAAFDAVVDAAIAAAGTTAERTVLAGFSQGTIMSLDALARGRRFAGVVGWSGRMARAPGGSLGGVPVVLVHGDADGVIPFADGLAARDGLAAAGARVDLVRIAGGGHGIGPEAAAAGYAFVSRLAGITEV